MPPSACNRLVGRLAAHGVERAGDDEGLPGQRLGPAASAGAASSSIRTPAAASRSISAALRGSSRNARTDRATTGPTSGTASSVSTDGRRAAPPSSRTPPRAPARRPRRRAECRCRAAAATARRCRLLSISATRLAADFLPIRSSAASCSTVEGVEVGVVVHQAARDELIDQRLAQAFDVHRAARREVQQAAPHARRARGVLAAPDDFVLGLDERAAAERTGRRHLPRRRVGGPLVEDGPDDLRDDVAALLDDAPGRPARMSRRATSCSLCSVAIWTVVPLSRTGSSTANGVTAPVRPTLTSMLDAAACAPARSGNLNASPSAETSPSCRARSRSARSSSLIDDAVGFERRADAARPATRRQIRDHVLDAVAHAPVRLDRTAPRRERARASPAWVAATAASPAWRDDLIGERAQAALARRRR